MPGCVELDRQTIDKQIIVKYCQISFNSNIKSLWYILPNVFEVYDIFYRIPDNIKKIALIKEYPRILESLAKQE